MQITISVKKTKSKKNNRLTGTENRLVFAKVKVWWGREGLGAWN